MNLDDLLSFISSVAKKNGISTPFIVGGIPRDRIIGIRDKKTKINDVDITTGNKDSLKLANLVANELKNSVYRKYDDGHSSIDYMGLHIDFSSNFVAPGVQEELAKMKVDVADGMKLELYSRDFTMNTLLESLDFSSIYDLTGEAISDIQAGLIKCPVDPRISIGVDPRRILRAIKFAIKFDFKIEDSLKAAMKEYRENIQNLPKKYAQDKIAEIVRIDPDKGIDLLIEYKILPLVDLPKSVYDILIQKRKLLKAI